MVAQAELYKEVETLISYINKNHKKGMPLLFWIDLFCGAGGTSSGIHLSKTNSFVVGCVNHDTNAILSHKENHPYSLHFIEDIRDFEVVVKLKYIVSRLREEFPLCIIALWSSLECTNHSKAKGGLSKDADSRTLANHMYMYLEELDPEFFYVENVREFLDWGPVQIKVIKDKNGNELYCPLEIKEIKETPEEKAIRKTLKIKYKKKYSLTPIWEPIKERKKEFYLPWVEKIKGYGYQYEYRILNAADYGARQSRERLFIQFAKYPFRIVWPEPSHAKTVNENTLFPLKKWMPVKDVLDLKDEGESIFNRKKPYCEKTLKRIKSGLEKFVVNGDDTYLNTYYGNGSVYSLERPSPTLTTKDRIAKVKVKKFIDQQYGNSKPVGINQPLGALTTNPKYNIVTPWIMDTNFNNIGRSIEEPASTVIACRKWQYLVNPQYKSKGGAIDVPCFTLIARMDKSPPSVVTCEEGNYQVNIFLDDSPTTIEIKKLMSKYGIIDIKMRGLKIPELKQIQGFPKDYKLIGTQTEQKKYIGNAVEVTQAAALVKANFEALKRLKLKEA